MVERNLVDSALNSLREDNSATIIDREHTGMHLNRDDNDDDQREEAALEKYSHEDFDKLAQEEENLPIIEINANFPQETAMETYDHEDFDKLVQEEETHQIIETNNNFPQETAIETYNHEDFEKLVQEKQTSESNINDRVESAFESYNHQAFDNLIQEEEPSENNINDRVESAFESYTHKDFDNFIQEEETSRNNINDRVESAFESYTHKDFDNFIQEEETSENNIHVRVESAFESYTHKDFDNLIQGDAYPIGEAKNTNKNNYGSYENVDTTFREEVNAHHTKTGFRNPTDTSSRDGLPEIHQDRASIVTASPLPSDMDTGVSVGAPEDVVTVPPLPPDVDAETANILQNQHPNNQITITYLAFFLMVAAVVTFFLAAWMARRRRSNRQKREVYQYLGGFDIEDIDLRRAITGGWHGQYRNDLAKGLDVDSDFETHSDSDDGSRSCGSGADETTIVFMERGDLSSPIQSSKRSLPFTMLVADRNIYLDESTNGADSDDDDIFSPIRTRPF